MTIFELIKVEYFIQPFHKRALEFNNQFSKGYLAGKIS
jgi:hypothetical protein